MSLQQLLASAGLGALRLGFALLGAAVPALLGIPGTSGVINVLWAGAFLVLPPLITRSFGSATVAGTVYSILALPLPLSGPSGFFPKILIGISTGLAADVIMWALRNRERIASILGGSVAQTVLGLEFAALALALQIPGADRYAELQLSIGGMAATVLGGALSGFLGYAVYSKIREAAVVQRLQSRRIKGA